MKHIIQTYRLTAWKWTPNGNFVYPVFSIFKFNSANSGKPCFTQNSPRSIVVSEANSDVGVLESSSNKPQPGHFRPALKRKKICLQIYSWWAFLQVFMVWGIIEQSLSHGSLFVVILIGKYFYNLIIYIFP